LLGSNPRPRVASSRAHNIGPGLIFALAPPKPLNTRPRKEKKEKEKNLQKIVFEAMGKEKKKKMETAVRSSSAATRVWEQNILLSGGDAR
jgi:hypothetical protein